MTHGAMALQPNGFRFRFIPRKVPGLSANPLGFRGGAGTMVVGKVPPWTAVRLYHALRDDQQVAAEQPSRNALQAHTGPWAPLPS